MAQWCGVLGLGILFLSVFCTLEDWQLGEVCGIILKMMFLNTQNKIKYVVLYVCRKMFVLKCSNLNIC